MILAASPGLEPRLTESESAVLPLDDEAILSSTGYIRQNFALVKYFIAKNRVFDDLHTYFAKTLNYTYQNFLILIYKHIFLKHYILNENHRRENKMKKIFAVLLCLGLSGCYYAADGYYDAIYTAPSASYYGYTDATYAYPATAVVYEQPVVTYYESYHYSAPHRYYRHHPTPPRHHTRPAPHHHHSAAPRPHHSLGGHGGGHKNPPAHNGGSHHRKQK